MARGGSDGWSRLVGTLKVALPLAALGLLSTLFLVSSRIDPEDAIPYARVDVESRLREPRLTKPAYAGTTADGAALTMQATEARPATTPGAPSTAVDVTGNLTTPDGQSTDLRSDEATLDPGGDLLHFAGNVVIRNSAGYDITAATLTANLRKTELTSDDPVQATGPTGTIRADSLSLTRNPAAKDSYLLVFNGRVKLVYQPQ